MHSRAVITGLVAVAALAVLRVGVAPVESCPRVTAEEAHAAAEDAVGWFAANQRPDGSFAYLLDESGEDLGGYNITRHAGVLMSLYQAAGAGIDGAQEVADRGLDWARDNLQPAGGGQAFGAPGSTVPTGASALLLSALVEPGAPNACPPPAGWRLSRAQSRPRSATSCAPSMPAPAAW